MRIEYLSNGVIGLNGIGVLIDGREIECREEGLWEVKWKICLESVCDLNMMNDCVDDIQFVKSVSVDEEKVSESSIRVRSTISI